MDVGYATSLLVDRAGLADLVFFWHFPKIENGLPGPSTGDRCVESRGKHADPDL